MSKPTYEQLAEQVRLLTDDRRVAACVNACKGIDTDKLEAMASDPVEGMFGRLAAKAINDRNTVVAEMVALKGSMVKCTKAVEHWNSWADAEDKIALCSETPATAAQLAALRAEGVEMFAVTLGHLVERMVNDRYFETKALEFARQLRESKGANHE